MAARRLQELNLEASTSTAEYQPLFTPRAYQRPVMDYLDRGGKRAVWVVHRRGGKDLTLLHQTVKAMHRRRGMYWHIFPSHEQGKKAIWEGFTADGQRIMELVFPASIRKSPREFKPNGETVVELKNGSMWRLMGSDHLELVGAGPVGVVFSEFSLARPKTWDLIRPMLRENQGWAAFVYTPRGKNHGWRLFESAKKDPTWFCELLTLNDTRAYDPEVTVAEERASGMPEELIEQEYFCSWTAALVGSIFGKLLGELDAEGRICAFEHPRERVHTCWDLGMGDANAIWFFRFNEETRGVDIIDHYENQGEALSHYVGVLRERGYKYGKHFLPHDANHRNLLTGGTVEDQLKSDLGVDSVVVMPPQSPLDGIQAGRALLLVPSTRFHERCADGPESGLEALRAYQYAYDEEKKVFDKRPLHNWASHTGDGFRYLAAVAPTVDMLTRPPPKREPPKLKPATLDSLFAAQNRRGGTRF